MTFKPIKHRSAFGYDTKEASDQAAQLHPYDPVSLTVQSQAEDTDLNKLMERMGVTGRMPENVRIPTYGDFSDVTDYRSAIEAIRAAAEGFMELPANIRARFDNDPQLLLEFCSNDSNRDEATKLGLLKQPQPQPAPQVNTPVAQGAPGGPPPQPTTT